MPPAWTENTARAHTWIDPHDPVRQAAETRHLAAHEHRIAALPAVGEDHDHRPASHAAPPVAVVELLQRVADPRPARPVGRRRGGALDGSLRVPGGQRARQAREPSGEGERLGVGAAAGSAGQELQVGARVGLHRAGDVAEHHEPAAGLPPPAVREADRVPAGTEAASQGSPHVDLLSAPAPAVAARAPHRGGQLEARHQPIELCQLVRVQRLEALARQVLLVACHRLQAPPSAPSSSSAVGRAATEGPPACTSPGHRRHRTGAARRAARRPRAPIPGRTTRPDRGPRRSRRTLSRTPEPETGRRRTRRGRSSTGASASGAGRA